MWGIDDYDWCESLSSDIFSGGIIVIWDHSLFYASQKIIGDRWIILDGQIVKNNFNCCIGIIYGPNDRTWRNQMYESLKLVCSNIGKPILFLGDFNEVVDPSERIRAFRFDAS